MKLEVVGTIEKVYPVVVISSTFRVREFVLALVSDHEGIIYTNFARMQLRNSCCDLLDENDQTETLRFVKGDKVKVTFSLKGTWNKMKSDVFNNLNAYNVETFTQEYAPVASAPVSQEMRRDNFNAQVNNYNSGKPESAFDNLPAFQYPNGNETIDDLPF